MVHINQRIAKNQTWHGIKRLAQWVYYNTIGIYWDRVRTNVCQVLHTA